MTHNYPVIEDYDGAPGLDPDRLTVTIVMLVLLLGQWMLLEEAGVVQEVVTVYSATVPVVMYYGFRLQINYALMRIIRFVIAAIKPSQT